MGGEREEEKTLYHLKGITWEGKPLKIVTQNINGPCPLLAIANVLLLRGDIKIHPDNEIISSDFLVTLVGDALMDHVGRLSANASEEARLNSQQNVSDAMAVMHKLLTGLDVNVGFTKITDFEYTPECIVFDLLNIRLVHGWLADPSLPDVYAVVERLRYNQLIEKVISSKTLESPKRREGEGEGGGRGEEQEEQEGLLAEGLIAEGFLADHASQLTYQGIFMLNAELKDGEVVVFFRNNHFATLHKRKDELFLLLTDQGFKGEAAVWETLSNVEGDGFFVNSSFVSLPSSSSPPPLPLPLPPPSSSSSSSSSSPFPPSSSSPPSVPAISSAFNALSLHDDPDFLLAKQLQEEEDRAAAAAAEAAQSQQRTGSRTSASSSRPNLPPATQQKAKDDSCLIS